MESLPDSLAEFDPEIYMVENDGVEEDNEDEFDDLDEEITEMMEHFKDKK